MHKHTITTELPPQTDHRSGFRQILRLKATRSLCSLPLLSLVVLSVFPSLLLLLRSSDFFSNYILMGLAYTSPPLSLCLWLSLHNAVLDWADWLQLLHMTTQSLIICILKQQKTGD